MSILNGIFIDGPVFKARPKSIEADNGATIHLVCDVVGNPPADILWIHEPNDKVSARKIFAQNAEKSSNNQLNVSFLLTFFFVGRWCFAKSNNNCLD